MIKELPKTIDYRLSNNSLNEAIFNEGTPLCEKLLSEAGYSVRFKYTPNKKTKQKTKVGHYFLKLLNRHFHVNIS